MATTTGLLLSSIFKSNGSKPAPRGLPEVILPNSLMSAPATKVRPPPIRTTALTPSSCASRSNASEIPSGTPGPSALTGGLLMVMTAMSFSLVSCTKSFMEKFLWVADLSAFRGDAAGIDYQGGNALAMKGSVAERGLRSFCSTVIQVNIVFPGEAHAAVNLYAPVAYRAAGITGIHLGDRNGCRRIRRVFFQRPPCIVDSRTRTLGFQIHVRALVLHGLKRPDGFAKLFASLGIFDRDIKSPLHATYQFGGQRCSGDVESPGEVGRSANFLRRSVIEFNGVELACKVHGPHGRDFQARSLGIHRKNAVARNDDDEIGDRGI